MNQQKPLAVSEAASALGISPRTVRRLVKTGVLEGFRVGGQWRVSPAGLARFMRQGGRGYHDEASERGRPIINLEDAGAGDTGTGTAGPVSLAYVPLAAADFTVDKSAGVIRGVSVISAGEARGHGFAIDSVMLDQVAAAINASNGGVKARLGHDQLGEADGAARLIGRVKNARRDGQRVRADLHIASYAAKSPAGDLRAFVLGLAEEDPGAAGMSIVFEPAEFEQSDAGQWLARVADVPAVDLVGDPAANPAGLLSTPNPKGQTLNKQLRTYLESIGLSADATDAAAWQFYNGLQGDQRTKADGLKAADATALAERERVDGIHALAAEFGFGSEWAKPLIDGGQSIDHAKSVALDKLKETRGPIEASAGVTVHGSPSADARAGLVDALAARFGANIENPAPTAQLYRGMRPTEAIRTYLGRLGVRTEGMGPKQLTGAAWTDQALSRAGAVGLGWHGAGSFPAIMGDALNKAARIGYQAAPRTWSRWARRTTAPDFKTIHRPIMSDVQGLFPRTPGGELKYAQLGDTEETYVLDDFGLIVNLTRRAVVNDDLSQIETIPRKLVAAARAKEDDLAYLPLTEPQVMAETGKSLFHDDHANLGGGSAIGVGSIGAGRTAISKQKGPKGSFLGLQPAFLLVPAELATVAEQFVASTVDPAKSNDTPMPDFVRRLEVVVEPRLGETSTTAWFLAADPGMIDTVELAFLEDEPEPVIETEVSFDTDALRIKGRHTVAAKALDYRGLYKDPGA